MRDWQVGEPETAERRAQAVERSRGLSAPFSCAVAPIAQQSVPERRVCWQQQREQEGVGEGGEQQELLPSFPTPETGISIASSLLP